MIRSLDKTDFFDTLLLGKRVFDELEAPDYSNEDSSEHI